MKLFRKKQPPQLSKAQALQCLPVKNGEVNEEKSDSGEVLLSYPVRLRPWLAGLMQRGGAQPVTQRKKLQLDRLGTDVWELIDGHRCVKDIITSFADRHQLYYKEAEVSVTQFLKTLGRRGVIGLNPQMEKPERSK